MISLRSEARWVRRPSTSRRRASCAAGRRCSDSDSTRPARRSDSAPRREAARDVLLAACQPGQRRVGEVRPGGAGGERALDRAAARDVGDAEGLRDRLGGAQPRSAGGECLQIALQHQHESALALQGAGLRFRLAAGLFDQNRHRRAKLVERPVVGPPRDQRQGVEGLDGRHAGRARVGPPLLPGRFEHPARHLLGIDLPADAQQRDHPVQVARAELRQQRRLPCERRTVLFEKGVGLRIPTGRHEGRAQGLAGADQLEALVHDPGRPQQVERGLQQDHRFAVTPVLPHDLRQQRQPERDIGVRGPCPPHALANRGADIDLGLDQLSLAQQQAAEASLQGLAQAARADQVALRRAAVVAAVRRRLLDRGERLAVGTFGFREATLRRQDLGAAALQVRRPPGALLLPGARVLQGAEHVLGVGQPRLGGGQITEGHVLDDQCLQACELQALKPGGHLPQGLVGVVQGVERVARDVLRGGEL